MSGAFQHTEGIILQSIPFQDRHQILTLFTYDVGILKIFYRGTGSAKGAVQGLWAPLTVVEVVYRERDREILPCHEIAQIDSNHFLRQDLLFLEVAADLLRTIALSQIIAKPAPLVYRLLRHYMSRISQAPDPWALALSFQLKVLNHEGLISLPFTCHVCESPITSDGYTRYSHWFCPAHQSPEGIQWTEEEVLLTYHLATCRHFREIMISSVSGRLKDKVAVLFESVLNST